MAFSTSASMTLFLVATVACLSSVTTGEENPSVVDRQSRQMYVVPPQFYNYYNPYGMMMPAAIYPVQAPAFPIYPQGESISPASEEILERGSRQSITVLPATTECILDNIATAGLVPCTKSSGAKNGRITIKLPTAGQIAIVGIVRGSRDRITLRCTEMTAVDAFTKTGKIAAPSDTPRSETGVLQLVVTSSAENGLMKCTW